MKNEKTAKPDLLVSTCPQIDQQMNGQCCKLPVEYAPFASCGSVPLVGSQVELPITSLRDIGASQSLILDGVLPFCTQLDT